MKQPEKHTSSMTDGGSMSLPPPVSEPNPKTIKESNNGDPAVLGEDLYGD
ncbi:hypothetical protein A2U01_0095969 [Trifolium medium]|uniref:Uncharacterized protein n=1 Tax=Trifolium medium TaxID=97028 RepID=A0A392USG1_9FABA|nr:hypothetical protein [Trifolium medium]